MKNENINYSARLVLENSYPEVKDAEIIITYFDGQMTIGVKARYLEATKLDDGVVEFVPKQVGDYRVVEKTSTVEELCSSLKDVLNGVNHAVEELKAGRNPW